MRKITCHAPIWLLVPGLVVVLWNLDVAAGQGRKEVVPETKRAEQKAREKLHGQGVTDEQIKKTEAAWRLNPPQMPKAKSAAVGPAGKFEPFEKRPPKGRIALKDRGEPIQFSLSNLSAPANHKAAGKNTEPKEQIPAHHLKKHIPHGHHSQHSLAQPDGGCGSKDSSASAEKCKQAGEDFNKSKPQN